MKPLFPSSSKAKRHQTDHSQELAEFKKNEEAIGLHPSDRASKWSSFRAQIQDHNSNLSNMEETFLRQPTKRLKDNESYANGAVAPVQQPHQKTGVAKGPVSKWSSFITEEDGEEIEIRGRRDSWDRVCQLSNDPLESLVNPERVEEDIHPDFL
ncbi:hypothetical protein CDL12_23057 [Handroanthus impetiginosus]|uniref:Uncharacterized protein n=1 Tax=Handroanthus impetiginosus TaxID=429701 RepID=A0A2G9GGK6_9LAMI|nr:hypothetical protein CDL12_23057 [Handroanthus impetiginosus]